MAHLRWSGYSGSKKDLSSGIENNKASVNELKLQQNTFQAQITVELQHIKKAIEANIENQKKLRIS